MEERKLIFRDIAMLDMRHAAREGRRLPDRIEDVALMAVSYTHLRAIQINNAFWPMLDLTGTIGTILVYYVGISLMGNASAPLELAELLLIIWYLGRFWEPLNTLSNFYNNILSATASMERIFEIMDTPADVQDKPGAYDLPPIKGRVEFDHVNFYYDPEKPVLNDVSFVAEPGQTIALVLSRIHICGGICARTACGADGRRATGALHDGVQLWRGHPAHARDKGNRRDHV